MQARKRVGAGDGTGSEAVQVGTQQEVDELASSCKDCSGAGCQQQQP